jgi:2-succinyl-6-hydroxy-2,4-cyclohexadiene-1-carboxylate synthase
VWVISFGHARTVAGGVTRDGSTAPARLGAVAAPVVFLHGFAGTARHWSAVIESLPPGRFEPIAVDVADARPLTPDGVAELVAGTTGEPFTLVGYSMGGRLALHAALGMPERVRALVLVSASAGITDPGMRGARREADEALAAWIETRSIEAFIERWSATPLFEHDPGWVKQVVAGDERRCDPRTLAVCLRRLGQGAMEPMWGRLGELAMPTVILAGERDEAYVATAERLADAIPGSRLVVVRGAGHRVALEAPVAVAAALGGRS